MSDTASDELLALHRRALDAKAALYIAEKAGVTLPPECMLELEAAMLMVDVPTIQRAKAEAAEARRKQQEAEAAEHAAAELRHQAEEDARIAAMDWADKEAESLVTDDDYYGPNIDPDVVAAALRTAKQAGVDEERRRCLAIVKTVRAAHAAIFERPTVEACENIIDLIEDGK